jgi:hypothetical protein
MLTIGTLLGGTITVGLAATLLRVGPAPAPSPLPAPSAAVAAAPSLGETPPPIIAPQDAVRAARTARPAAPSPPRSPAAAAAAAATPTVRTPARAPGSSLASPHTASREDPLAREATLVSEARSALAGGDARAALQAVRAAEALPARQLVPEELAVERQALRALGRDGDADAVGAALKSQFPDSALAR